MHAGKLTQLHVHLGQVPPPAVYKGAAWQGVCQDALHAVACSSMHLAARMQAVRQKRGAAGRDALPDEVFGRLRGALFLGPSFQVTRNKLLFRDNLPELLAAAVPGELASSHHALQHSVTLSADEGFCRHSQVPASMVMASRNYVVRLQAHQVMPIQCVGILTPRAWCLQESRPRMHSTVGFEGCTVLPVSASPVV